jgi:uncharacterized protein (DUF305 family)
VVITSPRSAVVVALAIVGAVACLGSARQSTPPVVQPGAPGQPTKELSPAAATKLPRPGFTKTDVAFMQGMIAHHAQAIDMTKLLETRTTNPDMRKLAERIAVSQADEIKMMQRWLLDRGQGVPGPPHMHGGMLMPGMLTQEEMARLAAASGPEFDKLFLEGMIKHHGGALTMVHDLFATAGAGQESEMFAFASDVDADQRMEIERMAAMLKELEK